MCCSDLLQGAPFPDRLQGMHLVWIYRCVHAEAVSPVAGPSPSTAWVAAQIHSNRALGFSNGWPYLEDLSPAFSNFSYSCSLVQGSSPPIQVSKLSAALWRSSLPSFVSHYLFLTGISPNTYLDVSSYFGIHLLESWNLENCHTNNKHKETDTFYNLYVLRFVWKICSLQSHCRWNRQGYRYG